MQTTIIPRSKQALLAFINRFGSQRSYEGHRWLFCFNVKAHGLDLGFDHLVKRVVEMGYDETVHLDDPFWLADAKQRHTDNEENLFDWGVEDARTHFRGNTVRGPFSCQVEGAPWYASMLPDGDCYRQLRDGTAVDARFCFFGRSGGWLTLTMFDDVTLDSSCELENCDYRWLRRLAKFVEDLHESTKNASQWIEEAAAFTFFANICDACQTRESRNAAWLLDQSGEH